MNHPIPEDDIRRRFDQSRRNLLALLPRLSELKLYDNSSEADPKRAQAPLPELLLHWRSGKVVAPGSLRGTPDWANRSWRKR